MILPSPANDFTWQTTAAGPALVCEPLASHARHFFTTRAWRLGGSQQARDDERAWREVAEEIGTSAVNLLRAQQVHGARVVVGHEPFSQRPDADILLTTDPRFAVAVQAADCVPILLADTRSSAVAAVHAGWRGLVANAPAAAVAGMASECRSRPEDLVAAIGPSIGPCCYEVGPDVRARLAEAGFIRTTVDRWLQPVPRESPGNPSWRAPSQQPDREFLDLWSVAVDQLKEAGVARVYAAGLCTASHSQAFCSFRRDGAGVGRIAGVIRSR